MLIPLLLSATVIVLPFAVGVAVLRCRSIRPATCVALIGFACLYGALLGVGEQLVGQDYAQITGPGIIAMPVWPPSGRFFPLAFQEFNILHHFGAMPTIDYAFVTLQVALLIFGLWRLLDETPTPIRGAVIALILVTPGVLISLQGLIYPERGLLVCVPLWLLAFRDENEGFASVASGALIVAYMLLLKETSFLLIGGFVGARVIAGRRDRLSLICLALCIGFVLVYQLGIAPHVVESYAPRGQVMAARIAAAKELMVDSPLLLILAALAAVRVAAMLRDRSAFDPLWDSAAVGAVVFAAGYIALGMYRPHYVAPANLIAVAYLGRRIALAVPAQRRLRLAATLGALMAIISLRVDARWLMDRKVFAAANATLARTIEAHVRPESTTTLYFQHIGGFEVMEFAAFLRHRGTSVTTLERSGQVLIKTPHRFAGDRCFPSQNFRCEYVQKPESSDLVVTLPGH